MMNKGQSCYLLLMLNSVLSKRSMESCPMPIMRVLKQTSPNHHEQHLPKPILTLLKLSLLWEQPGNWFFTKKFSIKMNPPRICSLCHLARPPAFSVQSNQLQPLHHYQSLKHPNSNSNQVTLKCTNCPRTLVYVKSWCNRSSHCSNANIQNISWHNNPSPELHGLSWLTARRARLRWLLQHCFTMLYVLILCAKNNGGVNCYLSTHESLWACQIAISPW